MKIEFEKIIEKANIRKESLESLQKLLTEAEDRLADLKAVQDWVVRLSVTFSKVDAEGRAMLPQSVRLALQGLGSTSYHLSNAYSNVTQGLVHLYPEDEE